LFSLLIATKGFVFGDSPVSVESGGTYYWKLSAPGWTQIQTTEDADFTISIGDGDTSGTILVDVPNTLNIFVSGEFNRIIPNWPNDWQTVSTELCANEDITVYSRPEINIMTTNRVVVSGEDVIISNATRQIAGAISAFIWNDGQDNYFTTYDYGSITTSYSSVGTYDLSVTAIGSMWSKTFNDYITVIGGYTQYNSDISREYIDTLKLPNTIYDIQLPPNEWTTDKNIQNVFDKLEQNNTYLENTSKLYKLPPTDYYGWLGSSLENGTETFKWYLSGNSSKYNDLTAATDDVFTQVNDFVNINDRLYVANDASVMVLSSDSSATQIGETLTQKAIDDPFISIKSIAVDSDSNVFVLDNPKNRIIKFSFNENRTTQWKSLIEWGGLGGLPAKTKFNNPNEIKIVNDNVYVVDKGNHCIKKYTNSGAWLNTYSDSNIINPISVAISSENKMYVLMADYIVVLNSDGDYLTSFAYESYGATPKKIVTSRDGGFIYVCVNDRIIKLTPDGDLSGTFALNDKLISYNSCYHDANRNFYIASNNAVYWYSEIIEVINLKSSTTGYAWPLSASYINKDEYVQDWVYGYAFARYWDNLELFRRSITGKPQITQTQPGVSALTVRNLTPDEILTFNYNKSAIYVGVNEFNSAPVVNRCIEQLYNCQEIIVEMLS